MLLARESLGCRLRERFESIGCVRVAVLCSLEGVRRLRGLVRGWDVE